MSSTSIFFISTIASYRCWSLINESSSSSTVNFPRSSNGNCFWSSTRNPSRGSNGNSSADYSFLLRIVFEAATTMPLGASQEHPLAVPPEDSQGALRIPLENSRKFLQEFHRFLFEVPRRSPAGFPLGIPLEGILFEGSPKNSPGILLGIPKRTSPRIGFLN